MQDFVEEFLEIDKVGGIEIEGELKKVDLHHCGCDAPAKSFVKDVQGHTGNSGCHFCDLFKVEATILVEENGEIKEKTCKVVSTVAGTPRTDSSYRERLDIAHHHRMDRTIIENLPIDMVE